MSRISKTTVGTISVTALRDGERTLPFEALKNLSDETLIILRMMGHLCQPVSPMNLVMLDHKSM